MKAGKLLVFAPHPDDEIIGCGGALALAHEAGREIMVVVVTDGAQGLPGGGDASIRESECRAGLKILGITEVMFWHYPDSRVPLSGMIVEQILELVNKFAPTEIFLPAPGEEHPDHRRTTRVILKSLQGNWAGLLRFYETVKPQPLINSHLDVTPVMEQKLEALRCHQSQTNQYDYETNSQTLARLRGVGIGVEYTEAYLDFPWDGEPENFFETRPLISVIVRANDPVFLTHSLGSLANQSYDQFEVILVWHGEGEPDLAPYDGLDIRWIQGELNRTRNLNLGLDAVQGLFVSFLDQDDVLFSEHFELLLAELQGRPGHDMVYSGCMLTACERQGEKIIVKGEIEQMNRDYVPGCLLLGNYIPLHTAFYRAAIFRVLRFDESLEAYEDWEFLARVESTGFQIDHVDAITCEYRLFDATQEDTALADLHEQKGYLPWRNEVLGRLTGLVSTKHLDQLASHIDFLGDENKNLQEIIEAYKHRLDILKNKDIQARSLENFLNKGLQALGIERPGLEGYAELVGRSLPEETLFSIILPVHDTDPELLSETLYSVFNQAYPGWELCLVDDGSTRKETLELLDNLKQSQEFGDRLHYARREQSGGVVAASNEALSMASAPYVVFLDHDDLLAQEALLILAIKLREGHHYGLLYSGSRTVDLTGQALYVYHKSEWAPETLMHLNYINHLTVVRRDLLQQVGGLRAEFDGSQDWDLLFRITQVLDPDEICHLPEPLYDWRATDTSVAYQPDAKPWVFEAAKRAVHAKLEQIGLSNPEVLANPYGGGVCCKWQSATPSVEVIIPTHSNLEGLQKCVHGVLEETDYPDVHITIIANRVTNPAMKNFINEIETDNRIRILQEDGPFNWSRFNNRASADTEATLLLFMNDDVEIIDSQWLANMVRYLELPGVGVIGATLLYPDGTVQHNGVQTSPVWVAGNIDSWGSRNELSMTRNVSAVTGACMLVSRETFKQGNRFDERLAVNYNDIDFCLAIRAQGLRIVQPADVRLIHHEMISRGELDSAEKKTQWKQESDFMREKWGNQLEERYILRYNVFAQTTRILKVS